VSFTGAQLAHWSQTRNAFVKDRRTRHARGSNFPGKGRVGKRSQLFSRCQQSRGGKKDASGTEGIKLGGGLATNYRERLRGSNEEIPA